MTEKMEELIKEIYQTNPEDKQKYDRIGIKMSTVVKKYGLKNAIEQLIEMGEDRRVISEYLIRAELWTKTEDKGRLMNFQYKDQTVKYDVINKEFRLYLFI
jgi:hypothetical protein